MILSAISSEYIHEIMSTFTTFVSMILFIKFKGKSKIIMNTFRSTYIPLVFVIWFEKNWVRSRIILDTFMSAFILIVSVISLKN